MTLLTTLKTSNFFLVRFFIICIWRLKIFKFFYKVFPFYVVNPNCLLSSPKDQTLIWQANEKNSTVIIPKPIPWECLTQSNEWNFKQLLALKPIEQPKLMSITEDGQGNVQINFEPRKKKFNKIILCKIL